MTANRYPVIPQTVMPKILIVEDEAVFALLLKNMLESFGYTVCDTVCSGEEAVDRAESIQPDLIIMDVFLNGRMDGIEAAERIHSSNHVPILFSTQYDDEEIIERAKLSDPVGYLLKPYDKRQLKTTIEIALHLARTDNEKRQSEKELQAAHNHLERRIEERTADLIEANRLLSLEIAERKRVESELQREHDQVQMYFNTAGVMLVVLDRAGRIIHINLKGKQILGYSDEEIVGRNWFDVCLPSEIRTEIRNLFDKFFSGNIEPLEYYENPIITKTGEKRIVAFHNSYLRYDNHKIVEIIFSGEDITDRKIVEEALRVSEEKYRTVADFTYDWEYWLGLDGKFCYVSPSCERVTGYHPDEFLKDPFLLARITHPMDREMVIGHINDALNSSSMDQLDFRIINRNGEEHWISHYCQPVYSAQGVCLGRRGNNRDITKRKKAEAALREAHDLLEIRVKERTAELLKANERLMQDITARISAEKKLRVSEERFRGVFAQSPIGIELYNAKGRLVDCNESCLRIVGVLNKSDIANINFFSDPHLAPDIKTKLRNNEIVRYESEFNFDLVKEHNLFRTTRSGRCYLEIVISPLKTRDQVQGYVIQRRDISESKQTSEMTRIREARLRSLLKISQLKSTSLQEFLDFALEEAVALSDSKIGYINYYDEKNCRFTLHSWSENSMKECSISKPTTQYDLEKAGAWGEAVRQRQPIIINDFQAPNPLKKGYPEGHAHIFRFMTLPIFSDDQIIAVVGVANKDSAYSNLDLDQLTLMMDSVWKIAEHRRMELALHQEKERFKLLIEESPFGVSILAPDGSYRYVNPKFTDMFGYSLDDIPINQNWHKKAYPIQGNSENSISTWILNSKVLPPGQESPNIYIVTCQDNSEKIVRFSPVTIPGGDQFITYEDLTSLVRAEDQRKKVEDQLLQAQKMQAIGTLAGGIAHDFNNILAAIIGYTELVKLTPQLDSRLYGYLEQVLIAGQRAKELIRQILDFSRRGESEHRPIELAAIVKESLKLLRSSLPTTIEIRQIIEPKPLIVKGDPTQIHQIMMNLCTNAAHAMGDKGGVLEVRLSLVELDQVSDIQFTLLPPGLYGCLTVGDTGHGMIKSIMERIFEPFFTTKIPGEGTGMGLAVVYGIVKNYGGDIKVYSEVGKGSTFRVYLPLIKNESVEHVHENAKLLPKGSERILFVDDEEALAVIGRETLRYLGYQVTIQTSSLEALALFKSRPDAFDMVITDQTMPNMTGLELTREIIKIRSDIPIILCTGFSQQVSAETVMKTGAKRFLLKPLVIREVAEVIRAVFDDKK
ncbi:MAG: PAS domain S-box protein [Deltaproteobacteria bacterium]|nr:PAS domain S-box protein [Deltaproteobacteria bacterium]